MALHLARTTTTATTITTTTTSPAAASLPYHEPGIATILVQASLLLLLNVVNHVLDRAIYCGLLGQVLLGVAWGTPGARWLTADVEAALVQLGYLGLLLLVYEGGLSTPLAALRANLALSAGVALTGIGLPIALSFGVLPRLMAASSSSAVTPLQCFAAGAALCSTSLGTTFAVLSSSGLVRARLGVVLASAAMLDDVAGLVMVQVMSNLGGAGGRRALPATTIVRPVLVSLAWAVVAVLVCRYIVQPAAAAAATATVWMHADRAPGQTTADRRAAGQTPAAVFVLHTLILVGCVAGAAYAGTSTLFAAYVAGAAINWWDTDGPHLVQDTSSSQAGERPARPPGASTAKTAPEPQEEQAIQAASHGPPSTAQQPPPVPDGPSVLPAPEACSGLAIYERYYQAPVNRILRPLFFASIGFSIPITDMFSGPIVWKGIVYAILMAVGKMACGVWLLRLSWPSSRRRIIIPQRVRRGWHKLARPRIPHFFWYGRAGQPSTPPASASSPPVALRDHPTPGEVPSTEPLPAEADTRHAGVATAAADTTAAQTATAAAARPHTKPPGVKPRSVYPALILGCGMTARGEIGFLISSIAESKQVFASSGEATSSSSPSDIFLVVTWAIVLCTIVGPIAVGLLVQRVRKLEQGVEKEGRVVRTDVLGAWGVH